MTVHALIPPALFVAFALFTLWASMRLVRRQTPQTPEPIQSARDMVPAFSDAKPDAPTAGNVRLAFRAHVMWQNDCTIILLAWKDMLQAPLSDEQRITQLCELYSRAIFECAFCRHFDGADPCSDVVVLEQIRDAFGDSTTRAVHDLVATRGIVLRRPKLGNGAAHP